MILETLRIVADHLASAGATGLAQQIATTPRDSGDAQPAPPTILDETRSLAVALGRTPDTLPALTVSLDDVVDMDPRTSQKTRDGEVAVLLRYVVRGPTDTATRDFYYTVRAVERSLDLLPHTTRNGVELYSITDMRIVPPMQPLEDQWVVGGLRVVFQVRGSAA
jgi:hypothetical protein